MLKSKFSSKRIRRVVLGVGALALILVVVLTNPESYETWFTPVNNEGGAYGIADEEAVAIPGGDEGGVQGSNNVERNGKLATEVLEELEVKGRAPKTGYSREEFYSGWPTVEGCSLRQKIIKREFGETAVLSGCDVVAGEYDEPYTGEHKKFTEKSQISKGVQIDHVVALSDAWQKGAQGLDKDRRYELATDPLNLLAVDASTNQGKSDGDAATWLPSNKKFRCQYVARQVSVKYKYQLWVTEAEKGAITKVLENCPQEPAVGV